MPEISLQKKEARTFLRSELPFKLPSEKNTDRPVRTCEQHYSCQVLAAALALWPLKEARTVLLLPNFF